jgi:hypothetical protein
MATELPTFQSERGRGGTFLSEHDSLRHQKNVSQPIWLKDATQGHCTLNNAVCVGKHRVPDGRGLYA